MLISFSGYDGAGKTTQISLLLSHYRSHGFSTCSIYDINPTIRYHSYSELEQYLKYFQSHDVIHLRFRLNSDENNEIMKVLEYSDFSNYDLAKTSALQGFYDYYLMNKYVIEPLLNQNKTIIFDRHYYDEIAFKTVYGCDFSYLSKIYDEILKPDIAFYLHISPELAKSRNIHRPDGSTTLYKNMNYIVELGKQFERLLRTTNLTKIDGMMTEEQIHTKIIEYVTNYVR